jgi:hypothetical protein
MLLHRAKAPNYGADKKFGKGCLLSRMISSVSSKAFWRTCIV